MTQRLWLIAAAISFTTSAARGQSVFPAGAESKRVGIESALSARNGPAVLYNPANLSLASEIEPFAELGYVSAEQTYEHRDFDQVRVRVRSPFVAIGYAGTSTVPNLNFGALIHPVRNGEQTVDGLPRRIAGIFETLDVTNKEEAWQMGLGLGYQLPLGFSIGSSLVMDTEKRSLEAKQVGDDQLLIKLKTNGTFYTPRFGLRYEPAEWLRIGLSYRPERVKTYKGSQKAATSDGTTDPTVANFEPAMWSFGIGTTYSSVIAELHLNIQQWEPGRDKYREGLTAGTTESELSNIVERSLVLGYELNPEAKATIAYGLQPSPWGDGRYTGEVSESRTGADFGQANNIDRRFLALGGSLAPYPNTDLELAALRAVGEREVRDDGDRPGFYQAEVFLLSASATMAF